MPFCAEFWLVLRCIQPKVGRPLSTLNLRPAKDFKTKSAVFPAENLSEETHPEKKLASRISATKKYVSRSLAMKTFGSGVYWSAVSGVSGIMTALSLNFGL